MAAAAAPPANDRDASSPPFVKVGAGLLLYDADRDAVLLLQRRSTHHDRAWGLPGGNAEDADGADSLATARREAEEEMGQLPPFTLRGGALRVVRGAKRGQPKLFSVHVAAVDGTAACAYAPTLNHEHRAWRWIRVADVAAAADASTRRLAGAELELHPVVERVFRRGGLWWEVQPEQQQQGRVRSGDAGVPRGCAQS